MESVLNYDAVSIFHNILSQRNALTPLEAADLAIKVFNILKEAK